MTISDLFPQTFKDFANKVLDKTDALLKGETLRAIQYGGAAVLYLVAKAIGFIPDVPFGEAVAQASAAAVILIAFVESARHYVSSPATVARLTDAATPAEVGGGIG